MRRVSEQPPADVLPVDPDIERAADVQHHPDATAGPFPRRGRRRWPRLPAGVLAAVYAGGVGGGLARYGLTTAWPTPSGRFPWATFTVNTGGAFALALLLVLLTEVVSPHRYARPLLGTGFLGAFTTFSSVMVSTAQLTAHRHPRTAALYLTGSLLAALGAASFGLLLGRALAATRQRGSDPSIRRRR